MEVLIIADIKFEIEKELNLISWNGKEAKYDLMDWAPEHEKMGKGVTLSGDELKKLRDVLNEMNL